MRTSGIFSHSLAAIMIFLAAALTSFGQGITTAAVSGIVIDKEGAPLGGATVTVLHVDSGTRSVTTTRPNGQYNVTGLRVGGPYTVTASAPGLPSDEHKEIYLSLANASEVNLSLGGEVVALQTFKVSESQDVTFDPTRMGNTTAFTGAEVGNIVSIRRDIQDLANLDPRMTLVQNTSTGEFQLSAQGQNYRYNSFLVDGVQANDPFGLNGSGTSSWRSPVPLEAIESFDIQLTPFDVRRSGFTGAFISAIVKSGTNDLHGSLSGSYTDKNVRGKNPVTSLRESFHERSFTATLGGPIVPNKLFFYLAWDDFRRISAPPSQNFKPDDSEVAKIVASAQGYGYDPGGLAGTGVFKQETYLAKIDWNISDQHHAKFTYRRTDSSVPQFANYNNTSVTSFSNYWYQAPRKTDSYAVEVDSNWTPNFHTEATASYIKYNGTPKNNGKPFPEVIVNNVAGTRLDTGTHITSGGVDLGTEFSRQFNQLYTKEKNGKLYGDYSIGDHTLTFGGDFDRTESIDNFVQAFYGSYTFSGTAGFASGSPITAYTLQSPSQLTPGYSIDQAFAAWSYTNYGLLAQDVWRPNTHLTILAGVRFDVPYNSKKPAYSQIFPTGGFSNNGIPVLRNDTVNDGNYTFGPRVGFNYQIPAKFKIAVRGGVGLFQGTNPVVWLANPYQNAGVLARVSASGSIANPVPVTFSPNPYSQPVPPATPPTPVFNVTDPNFRPPLSWKGNLGVDLTLPKDFILTVEMDGVRAEKEPLVTSLNIKGAASGPSFMPDGRNRYNGNIYPGYSTGITGIPTAVTSAGSANLVTNTAFNNVYYLSNTNRGGSQDYSLSLRHPMKNHWEFSAGYTHEHATEVSPFTSSVAASNFSGRAYFNPNEEFASISNYNVRDKFVVTASYEFHFLKRKDTATTIAAQFIAQTGHPFSWTFKGDANGDGLSGNDLLYVPTGLSDPKVIWNDPAEATAFFNFVNNTQLKNYIGKVVPRNGSVNPWQRTINLMLTQQIPIYKSVRLEGFVQLLNFANFLSKKWGLVEGQDFPYSRRVVGAAYDPTANGGQGAYRYFFNSNTLDGETIYTDLSRWQFLFGAKLKF